MKTKRSKFNQILLKSTSAFLAFWLSSVLVLACCGSHLWTVSASSVEIEEDSCPIQKGHKCCQKDGSKNKVSEDQKDKADCCTFKPNRTLSGDLQTVKVSKQSQIVEKEPQIQKPVYFIKNSYQPVKVYHSAIRNRGSTYLQNCVFRI